MLVVVCSVEFAFEEHREYTFLTGDTDETNNVNKGGNAFCCSSLVVSLVLFMLALKYDFDT